MTLANRLVYDDVHNIPRGLEAVRLGVEIIDCVFNLSYMSELLIRSRAV